MQIHPDYHYHWMWYADAPSKEFSEVRRIKRANVLGMIWRTTEGLLYGGLRFRYYNPEAKGLADPDHPDTFSYHYIAEKQPGSGKIEALKKLFDSLFAQAAKFHQSFQQCWELDCTGEQLVERMMAGEIADLTLVKSLTREEIEGFAANMERVGKEAGSIMDLLGGMQ